MNAKHKAIRLGLTGGVGCGKTTAAAYLKELGAAVVNADEISHALTQPNGAALPAILEWFGEAVFLEDGTLDRVKLGDIVFNDPAQRIKLESIIHPAVQREMLNQIDEADQAGIDVVVLEVPLLFETGMDALCDLVWVMSTDLEHQVLRIMNRDQLTRAQAMARIESQMPLEDKEKRADRIVVTTKSIEDVRRELNSLYKELIRRK